MLFDRESFFHVFSKRLCSIMWFVRVTLCTVATSSKVFHSFSVKKSRIERSVGSRFELISDISVF